MPFFTRKPRHLHVLLIAALALLAAAFAACGGGDSDSTDPPVLTPIDSELLPIVISSDMAVGENRFQVGLINQTDSTQVLGADLHLRFFLVNGQQRTLKFEADPDPIVLTKSYTHTHDDGTIETHEAGETGAYVAYVDFDTAGDWGVEVTGTTADGQELEPLTPTFNVLQTSFSLAIGDPAPQTEQPTIADSDIDDIDTSQDPIEEQHNMTIKEAVTSGRPTVISFSTPAFCVSQICGPSKEVFDDLYEAYKDDANFVHVEPYDIAKMRAGECQQLADCLVPAINDFRLQSEPWIFVIDADGKIAAKIDGICSYEEVETALKAVLPA